MSKIKWYFKASLTLREAKIHCQTLLNRLGRCKKASKGRELSYFNALMKSVNACKTCLFERHMLTLMDLGIIKYFLISFFNFPFQGGSFHVSDRRISMAVTEGKKEPGWAWAVGNSATKSFHTAEPGPPPLHSVRCPDHFYQKSFAQKVKDRPSKMH